MTPQHTFEQMISAFEQAALLLEHNRYELAKDLVTELPEPIYEKALRWYSSKVKDYYYYLIRFVLDSFEFKVMYCHKAGLEEDLTLYRDMMHSLQTDKPDCILDSRQAVVTNPDILSTPYRPITKPKGEPKPLPLFQ